MLLSFRDSINLQLSLINSHSHTPLFTKQYKLVPAKGGNTMKRGKHPQDWRNVITRVPIKPNLPLVGDTRPSTNRNPCNDSMPLDDSKGMREVKKVKFSHTRYRALGPELISVYRQSARR